MIDALGAPGRLLLLGGTSDIALAVAEAYAGSRPPAVVLAARPGPRREAAAARLAALGCNVEELDLDATRPETFPGVLDRATAGGDVDLAVVAFGVLGDPERAWTELDEALEMVAVNYTGAVAAGVALGQVVRRQGHGVVVALSSVAGERARRSNFVYGSTKAGLDAFYTGLGEALREHGGRVVVVRPGFVRSRMTAGLPAAPLATTPQAVAEAVVDAVASGQEQVWVPRAMRPVMSLLRHLPRPVFRRLPL